MEIAIDIYGKPTIQNGVISLDRFTMNIVFIIYKTVQAKCHFEMF